MFDYFAPIFIPIKIKNDFSETDEESTENIF
jgi:hypothetical protein